MTDRTLILSITLPADSEDLAEMTVAVESMGAAEEAAPSLILAAAEFMLRGRIAQELAQQNPYGTGDMVHAAAALNARLAAIDTLMHLPMTEGEVVGGTFDLSTDG